MTLKNSEQDCTKHLISFYTRGRKEFANLLIEYFENTSKEVYSKCSAPNSWSHAYSKVIDDIKKIIAAMDGDSNQV